MADMNSLAVGQVLTIPLNTADSSLPVTVLEFTLTNHGTAEAAVHLAGWMENAVCLYSGRTRDGLRHNRVARSGRVAVEPVLLMKMAE